MALQDFKDRYKYPDVKPDLPFNAHGWFNDNTDLKFSEFLSDKTKVVVEFGSWLGSSLRSLAKHAPNATIISVDTWLGSPEHHRNDVERLMLPTLYDQFIANCWEYRDRIIPLRADTITGMHTLHHFEIEPDLIYLDAGHEFDTVYAELKLLHKYFPNSFWCGDDYNGPVSEAVNQFTKENSINISHNGLLWWTEIGTT